jgi:transcription initiation factor TFIIF subunit alpha
MSHVKTEPTSPPIKAESIAGTSVPQLVAPLLSLRFTAEQGWQDIPLKCCTAAEVKDVRHHIIKFQSKQNVDIVHDFARPVRLHRKDPRNIQFQLTRKEMDQRKREPKTEPEGAEEAAPREWGVDMSQVAPDGGARKPRRNLFKRKTRQINLMDDAKRRLRYEEYYPWVLEDYEGRNVYVGNYEAGATDTLHVLFVFDKDGFKMVPAEKVYRFTPRNKYATLTLEEAEAKMEKSSLVPRWLMRHMGEQPEGPEGPDQRYRHAAGAAGAAATRGRAVRGRGGHLRTVTGGASSNDRDSDHDDLDFDEEFADDEEAPIMDGDEEENKLSERKVKKEMLKAAHFDGQLDGDDGDLDDLFETEKLRKVDKEGEKLRKVLHKTEGGVYDSDDDDKINPYLLRLDLESDDSEEVAVKQEDDGTVAAAQPRSIVVALHRDGVVVVRAPSTFLAAFPAGEWNPRKRRSPDDESPRKARRSASPVGAAAVAPSGVSLDLAGPDGVLITTKEVLDIVRDNPLTTKDLLVGLKHRVNAHRDNKQRMFSIVKQNLRLVDGKLRLKE